MGVVQLKNSINRGKQGKNIGISTGIPKLDKIIYGLQKRYLYTIGADTSGGKTSFALDAFIFNILKNRGNNKVDILYYSFEMASDSLYAKLLARHIFEKYKKVITYETILSMLEPISDEDLAIVESCYPWLEEISQYFTIYDKSLTPNGIYATCKEWLRNFGEFIQVDEHREDYIEKNPDGSYKIVIIDHVGLIGGSESKKTKIDLVADFFIYFRNKCNITGVFIQQLNRNAKSMDRKTNGYELVQLDDFKDTSGTTDASEVVIALYYPYREKIARCEGYPIQNVLKKKFRLCQILKNRYGQSDVNIGLGFYGEVGMFKELPKPEQVSDWEPYLDLLYNQVITEEVSKGKKLDEKVSDEINENLFIL